MRHNRGPRGLPVDDPRLDGREMGCSTCGGECVVYCRLCQGTGIGQHGDPDTSKCWRCRGTGVVPCACTKED